MKSGSKKRIFEILKHFLKAMAYFVAFCLCIVGLGYENQWAPGQFIVVKASLYVVLISALLIFVSMFIYEWDKLFPSDSSE